MKNPSIKKTQADELWREIKRLRAKQCKRDESVLRIYKELRDECERLKALVREMSKAHGMGMIEIILRPEVAKILKD